MYGFCGDGNYDIFVKVPWDKLSDITFHTIRIISAKIEMDCRKISVYIV